MRIQVTYGRSNPDQRQRYTYDTGTDSVVVEVGSIVEVPPTYVYPEPQEATVVEIGSDYTGPVVTILRVVEF